MRVPPAKQSPSTTNSTVGSGRSRKRWTRLPSPAMVVAVGALALSVGGNVTAAVLITSGDIKDNTIRSADIRNETITSRDIDNGAVTGADVKNHSLTPLDFSGSVQGPRGQRGPSNAYEQRLGSTVNAGDGESRTLTLANLPAGSYAIFGKALLGPTGGSAFSSGQCTLTAGTSSDLSYERLSDGWFGHIDTSVVHTFTTTGTVTMTCSVFGQPWVLGQGSDTSIVAIRVDAATKTSAAAAAAATGTISPAEAATTGQASGD
jgi:hypothetical protein